VALSRPALSTRENVKVLMPWWKVRANRPNITMLPPHNAQPGRVWPIRVDTATTPGQSAMTPARNVA
jgi:hypothetical protein